MVEWAGGVQFIHTLCRALVKGLRIVDGADSSGKGWRRATVALVHPGPIAHAVQLALHLPSKVAVSPVVQALHSVLLCGPLVFRLERKVKQRSERSF